MPDYPYQPVGWAAIVWFWGLPAAVLLAFLGMFAGVIPSPLTETRNYAQRNFELLASRNRLFEQMLFMDINVCIHTAHNQAEEDVCLQAAVIGCAELDLLREMARGMQGKKK